MTGTETPTEPQTSNKAEQLSVGLQIKKLGDDLAAEVQKGAEASSSRIEQLERRLDEADEKLKGLATGQRTGGVGIGAHAEDVKNASLIKMIAGHKFGWKDVPDSKLERDMVEETKIKAQESGVDTEGGFLVPGQFMQDMIIPLLEPRAIAIQLGANVLDGLVGSPVEIPAVRGDATAYWVGEDEEITASQLTIGQLKMEPRGLATLVPITNRLLRQTSNGAERIVRAQIARTMAKSADLAFFSGTGGKQPTGILNRSGIGSVDMSGCTFDATTTTAANAKEVTHRLQQYIGDLEEADALEGRLGWFMHPTVKRALMSVTDADGRPILLAHSGGLVGQVPDRLLGYPFATSSQLNSGATADLGFANFEDCYFGMWGTMEIAMSDVAKDGFERQKTYVRASMEVDMNLGNVESVSASTGLDVSGLDS